MALTSYLDLRRLLERKGFVMPEHQRDAWVSDYLEDVLNGHNLQLISRAL